MTSFFAAAQAVLDAVCDNTEPDCDTQHLIAAALRAAADRAIRGPEHYEGLRPDDYDNGWNEALGYIMSIADELEGAE